MAKGKGSHSAYRSAISGRFVTTKHGKSHPKKTVKETVKNPSPKKK
ncbi:MAG: hypothetical protein ROY99_13655 [Ignavibacterium sp.]|jgi:predicted RNA binding protein YcfA (HicA-like mRNA interferase family)|nr:hypothetical protein [Ignavibacterium sp.]